jgi:GxxExxY protein
MNEKIEALAKVAIDAAFKIHTRLGPGLFETVYEIILAKELQNHGLEVRRQVMVPVMWEGMRLDEGFRADLVRWHQTHRQLNIPGVGP